MLAVLTNIQSTKVLWYDGHHLQEGHHPIITVSTLHEFGSQKSFNIVEEVFKVDEFDEGNVLSWATLGIKLN